MKQPPLTPRQKKLAENLLKGKSRKEAAIRAGYSAKNPRQSAHQALEAIRLKMPQLMDKVGLTDTKLLTKYLQPALEAKETEFAKFEGKITDSVDVIAWGPRLTALDIAFKLKGAYAPVEQQLQHIHEITLMEKESARRTVEKIRALESDSKTPLLAESVDAEEK